MNKKKLLEIYQKILKIRLVCDYVTLPVPVVYHDHMLKGAKKFLTSVAFEPFICIPEVKTEMLLERMT